MNAEVFLDLLRSIVLFTVVVLSVIRIRQRKGKLCMVFFAMAVSSLMLSEIYWLVYDSLRPDIRMPFAANEVSEWAFFMLLGVSLSSRSKLVFSESKKEMFGAVLFAAANVALWIGWSGEFIQDILTGFVYAYFLGVLVIKIKNEGVLNRLQWVLLYTDCFLLIAGQTATFLVPDQVRKFVDLSCYVLLFATCAVFLFAAIFYNIKKDKPEEAVCYSYSAFAWVATTMYMSADIFYLMAMFLSIICFPLMYISIKREVTEE